MTIVKKVTDVTYLERGHIHMAMIEVHNLTKDYGNNRGIFNVSFTIKEGEVFGFLGPNGAGKTTTIRHLMGFIKGQEGSLNINGQDCWKSASLIKNDVGYLPGELAFPENMSGNEFISYMAHERNIQNMTYSEALKLTFEFEGFEKIKEMSLGNKRKLAIITAFMHDPKILILDEPTSGLDPIMQERFIRFILDAKKAGKTILLSSHIFSEVDAACDRIAIIKDGKIVSTIETSKLKQSTHKAFKIEFSSSNDYNKFLERTQFPISIKREYQNQIKINLIDQKMQALFKELSQVQLNFISEIKFTLEDYFMDFYDREKSIHDGKENMNDGLY